jgi:hypothetical protein
MSRWKVLQEMSDGCITKERGGCKGGEAEKLRGVVVGERKLGIAVNTDDGKRTPGFSAQYLMTSRTFKSLKMIPRRLRIQDNIEVIQNLYPMILVDLVSYLHQTSSSHTLSAFVHISINTSSRCFSALTYSRGCLTNRLRVIMFSVRRYYMGSYILKTTRLVEIKYSISLTYLYNVLNALTSCSQQGIPW